MFNALELVRQKFPMLDAKEALKVIANSELRKLKPGEVLIEDGTVAPITAYIAKGILRAYIVTEGVEEKTVLFRKEGEFIGAPPSMFKDEPAQENVEALENSVVFIIDWKGFRELAKKNIHLANAYARVVEEMMLEAVERIQDFTVLTPEERYIKFEKENRKLMQRIPLKYLASYLGVAVPSLSRIRARLAKEGN